MGRLMRLYNYINESESVQMFMMRKNCSQILSFIKKHKKVPVREFSHVIRDGIKEIKPRKDRRPKDMPLEFHKLFDEMFQKKFGWKVRSEGVFCYIVTKIKAETKHYDNMNVILPTDGFKFVYSNSIDDLYDEICLRNRAREQELKKMVDTYTDKNLQNVKDSYEVSIKCDKYYALSTEYFNYIMEKQ